MNTIKGDVMLTLGSDSRLLTNRQITKEASDDRDVRMTMTTTIIIIIIRVIISSTSSIPLLSVYETISGKLLKSKMWHGSRNAQPAIVVKAPLPETS